MKKRFIIFPRHGVILLLIALLAQVAMPLHAQNEPVVTSAGPAATQAGYVIKVNTLVDEWSTDTNTKASSKCSLREALQATITNNPEGNQGCGAPSIANFEEYTIDLLPGTYLLTRKEQLPNITKKIVIDGKKAVTIDGGSKSGRLDGIFIVASGELNLIKLKLQYGQRPFGGAIWVKGAGSARVTEVEFYRNLADNGAGNGDGGAVAVDAGAFYCVKSKFQENTARNAGGAISSGGVQVLLDRCEFLRNHAEVNGGAYAGFGGSEVTHPIIRESKFRENWVHPAVVPQNWPGQYQFTDDQSGGGAIYNKGFMEIERSEIFKNYTQKSKGGGAIYNQGDLRLREVAISDNKARPDGAVPNTLGGAILNDSTLIMLRTSIHGNEARFGGAIMNRTGGRLYVVNSTVADNLATSGGGIENGHNFIMNGAPAINNGGEVNIWHSTVVRANDNNTESTSIGNIQNGSVYMANSVIDSRCTGTIYTWGGNLFKQFCQRFSADSGVDKSNSDVLVQNVGQIGLEGLSNNGGPNLPEAQFLSVKVGGSSPAIDLGQDEYCIDPVLAPFQLTTDQIGGQRPQGTKCDAGALEVGSLPPQWDSDKPVGAGFFFPVTIFGKVWSTTQTLLIQNKGGGVINWSLAFENSAGGVYTLEAGPTSGGLGKDQSTTLTFRCTPTTLGWHEGMLLFKTDLPGQAELRYPVSCAMKGNPEDPLAWRSEPPGPLSAGQTAPGGQANVQINVGNQGANPMGATISWKNVLADTIKFVTKLGGVSAASQQEEITIPPGDTLTVDVTCTPPAPGLYFNTLTITTDDPISPELTYDISCEGVAPPSPEALVAVASYSELPNQRIMGMALSPDGQQLVAGHWDGEELAIYGISTPAGGLLSFKGKFSAPGMNTITGIRYTSDGKQLYYSSMGGNGVVGVNRDSNGNLTLIESITSATTYLCGVNPDKFCPIGSMGGARALDISPDDQNLYVTGINDNSLTVLTRNPNDGKLSFTQQFTELIDGANILTGPFGVLVSPDGKNVYVAGMNSNTLVVFSRNSETGRLRYLTHYTDESGGVTGLSRPVEIAISPDGNFVYVAGRDDDAVQIFRRNNTDGYLTPVEAVPVGDAPYHLLVSNDPAGERLAVALWFGDEVKVFARDRLTGKLSAVTGQNALPMDGPVYLVASANDRHLYAALWDGKGVAQLRGAYHAPLVQNLSPAAVPVDSSDFTLTVNGENFYPASTVLWNGTLLATTFVDERQLTAIVPGAQLGQAGSANVQVRTPQPGGGDAAPVAFTISAPEAPPVPAVESLSPPAITYGGEPLNVIVNGAGFTPQSQALLNGAPVKTTYVNATMLLVELTATEVGAPGPLVFSVENGETPANVQAAQVGAVTQSTPVKFTVATANAPAQPAISSFQPASLVAGSGEQWLTVRGYNFSLLNDAQSVAYWNGEPRATVVQDTNTLQMLLAAADLATAGTGNVTVYTPGVAAAAPQPFAILPAGQNPVPQAATVTVETDPTLKLLVSGSEFVDGAQVSLNSTPRPTTVVNEYVVAAAVTYADLVQGGLVQVANPGSGLSQGVVLTPQTLVFLPLVQQ